MVLHELGAAGVVVGDPAAGIVTWHWISWRNATQVRCCSSTGRQTQSEG